jgi:predicted Zn-dependent peptidase
VLIGGGPDAYDRIMERVTKVTPEEVQAAMKKYVEKYRFGILGPKDWVDPEVFKRP